ncbi:DUF6168 family protein [Cellulophaga sp. L1A9]|uniref:DUF6168 family protein n=1 Tax=Cellulophaga sp. L1A9 TaxID=2686362 RepID=UPI00351A8507
MLKSILQYILVFTLLFLLGKYVHLAILDDTIPFPLGKMYLFHYLFSLGICILICYLAYADILKEQLSLIYLATLFLKLIFFAILFKSTVFSEVSIPRIDRFSMLIPLILFLTVEVLFISKILKKI